MNIKKIRCKIDIADKDIVKLLNERARLILEIANVKKKKNISIYAPSREKDVYKKLEKLNKGPLDNKSLKSIYREVMSGSLSLEKSISVAYLGPELSFTHLAAMEKFGSSVKYKSCRNITDVFSEVEKQLSDYAVVPIENSTEGAVNHTFDMLLRTN